MSLHFEIQLTTWLASDTPVEYLAELRWHLGIGAKPDSLELPDYGARLTAREEDSWLPGGGIATLREQRRYVNRPAQWGLFLRTTTNDDGLNEPVLQMVRWLGRHCVEPGRFGWADRLDVSMPVPRNAPDWQFYAAGGFGYIGTKAKAPTEIWDPYRPAEAGPAPAYPRHATPPSDVPPRFTDG